MAVAELVQSKTQQFRTFQGVNQTDARTALDDKEFYWLENAMPIGNGNLRLLPGRATTLASVAAGIESLWGFVLNIAGVETSVLISVNTDGSMTQTLSSTGAQTVIGGAGTVTAAARLVAWKDTPILIIDPVTGYLSWDGAALVVLSAPRVGTDIAVFEGRVWIVRSSRTIEFSAPDSYTDFTAVAGAGTVTIADSAFPGAVVRLLSALEQLWIVGPGAVDAISNVQTTGSPLITTFSLTNIVSNVGSTHPSSVTAFFRTFLFLNHYGVYAIVGATPQKLSDKLDGFWPKINFSAHDDIPAAVTTLYDVFCWVGLCTITDPFTNQNRPLLLCFSQGKWFFADQGTLTWITGLLSEDGDPLVWGTDGTDIFQVFGAPLTDPVDFRIMTKLWDFGDLTATKQWLRTALEFSSDQPVSAAVYIENEKSAQITNSTVVPQNVIVFVGSGPITFVGSGPITWIGSGIQIVTAATPGFFGHYLGLTLVGSSAPWTLAALAMEVKPGTSWN